MKGKTYPNDIARKAREMKDGGAKQHEIAAALGVPQGSVHGLVTRKLRKTVKARKARAVSRDAEAGQKSIDEFCDDLGYDNDSIKALDVYRACMKTAQKLRGFKFPEGLGE